MANYLTYPFWSSINILRQKKLNINCVKSKISLFLLFFSVFIYKLLPSNFVTAGLCRYNYISLAVLKAAFPFGWEVGGTAGVGGEYIRSVCTCWAGMWNMVYEAVLEKWQKVMSKGPWGNMTELYQKSSETVSISLSYPRGISFKMEFL